MKHPHHHIPFLILATTILLLVSALYVFMYESTYLSVGKAIDARSQVVKEQADQSQAKNIAIVASSTSKDRSRLPLYFIPSDNILLFITSVENIGPQSGSNVTLGSINADPLTGATPGTIGNIQAHVTAEGSWASVIKALAMIENLPFASSISKVNLSSVGNIVGTKGKSEYGWDLSFDISSQEIVPNNTQ